MAGRMADVEAPYPLPSVHTLRLRPGAGLMAILMLYSRKGCCLCEGLEQRLRQLDLAALNLQLVVTDIDGPSTPAAVKARYDLEVPVLRVLDGHVQIPLARVSPRLCGEGLFNWLQRALCGSGGAV